QFSRHGRSRSRRDGGPYRAGHSGRTVPLRLRLVRGLCRSGRHPYRTNIGRHEKKRHRSYIMIATEIAVRKLSFLNNGQSEPGTGTLHPVTNPATGEVIAKVPYATTAEVDRIVRSAHEAFLKWRNVPVVDRVQVFYRYKSLLDKHHEELARILTTENGKTFED